MSVRSLSIRWKFSLMIVALTLAIITVLTIAAYIEFEESLLSNIDATLVAMAEGMRAALDDQENPEHLKAEFRTITGHEALRVHTRYRIWKDGSDENLFTDDSSGDPSERGLLHPPVEEQPEIGQYNLFNRGDEAASAGGNRFRLIWLRFPSEQQPLNVVVTRSCDYAYHEMAEFLLFLLICGGSVMLLTLLLVPLLVSSGLRTITDMGTKLRHVTRSNLMDDSYMPADVPLELRPFTSALQEMLSRLHRALERQEQLTADVAHELRTPLAVIKSTLQTLGMRPRTTAEYKEGIADALADVNRMETLIVRLLSLARLDAQESSFAPAEIRLDALLESVTSSFRPQAERLGGRLIYANGSPVCIQGDEAQLRQLFENLLDNALRYGPQGGRIHVALQDGPDGQVTVRIHDEGGAIPPESLPHLFDRFYRVESSRSQASGGSGLGLAIARKIVQLHRGSIAITSDPQTGTTVAIHLPRL